VSETYTIFTRKGGVTTRQVREQLAAFGWTSAVVNMDDAIVADEVIADVMMLYAWESSSPAAAQLTTLFMPGRVVDEPPVPEPLRKEIYECEITIIPREELQQDRRHFENSVSGEALTLAHEAVVAYTIDGTAGYGPLNDVLQLDLSHAIARLTDGLHVTVGTGACLFARDIAIPATPPARRLPAPPSKAGCLGALVGMVKW